MQLIRDEKSTGVKLNLNGEAVEVRFSRTGPVGGAVTTSGSGRGDRYELREAMVDSYANWRSDPRYEKWVKEPRFGFVIPHGDRQ
jgi:hypothetical protein